jgi:microcystin-dependent protein
MPVFDVPDILPVGSGLLWYSATAPDKYLLCDGTAISRTTYAALYSIIGDTYGNGDGSTTFNLPDLRQRFPMGKAASGTGNSLGDTGGAIDHTHTVPAHYHGMGAGADLSVSNSPSGFKY